MRDSLAVIAGLLGVVGFVPYITTIFRKENPTRPSRASWLIWMTLNVIILVNMYRVSTATLQMFGITLGSVMTAVLAMKYGKGGWERLDKAILVGAGAGLCFMFYDPTWSIAVSILVGPVLGAIPGIVEAWRDPSKELKTSWFIWATSSLISVLLVKSWTIDQAAQPISFLANQSIMFAVLVVRGKK
jgi:hypothetical protein